MAKILVIDDEAELRELMRLVLTRRGGHQVVLSAEGRDGLEKAFADPPDLAIVDVMMPGMTGYEVCRALRDNPKTASIPIIILTARGQPVDRDAALAAGADEHLVKPVTMAMLMEKVDEMLARRGGGEEVGGTLVMLSLRGGVGVTTLAVNIALLLAQKGAGEVCLADLSPASGHVALYLGLRPEPHWGKLPPDALDPQAIAPYLLRHDSGLWVLAAPYYPLVGRTMEPETARAVLDALAQRFAALVVDTPSLLDEATMAAVETASDVGLVVTAEPASVQTAIGTLRALKTWDDKLSLILNQVTPGPPPPVSALEKALKRPFAAVVPFDPAQSQAVARRTPLVIGAPDAPLSRALRGLVEGFGG